MEQISIFDAEAGQQAKQVALSTVEENADGEWKAAAEAAVYVLALDNAEFTTDELWLALSNIQFSTHDPRALGAVMVRAAKRGWIYRTDRVRESQRPVCHRRPLAVWRSRIQKEIGAA